MISIALEIRAALPQDATAISDLILSASEDFRMPADGQIPAWFVASVSPESIAGYIADPAYNYLVADIGEKLAGIIALQDRSYVFHLFVAPAYQRRGIASRLWDSARAQAIAAGNNQGFTVRASLLGVPFYLQHKFEITGQRAEKNGIAYIPMFLKPD